MSAFDDDNDSESAPRVQKGVKVNNSKSIINELPKKVSKEEFVAKAKEVNNQLNKYGERATELALNFKKILDDRTLIQNKTHLAHDMEKEVLNALLELGVDMNVDQHEEEGMGSMGLIMLLFRSVLIQRDKINQLDYTASLFSKQLKVIEKILKEKNLMSIDDKK
jgi:hypothetical protein